MTNPTTFNWTDPTTNTDGTPIAAGEITGYTVGVRSTSATGSVAGTYPIMGSVTDPTATSELFTQLNTMLKPDTYAAAIRTDGPVPSAWLPTEVTFTIVAPQPNPPSTFAVS